MKTKNIIIMALALGISASSVLAQNTERPKGPRPPGQGRPEGGPGHEGRPLIPPLIAALDANKDGTISADELANASAAVKSLDKNGDGAVQMEELRPKPPEGAGEHKDGERKGPPPGGVRPDGERKGPPPNGPRPGGEGNFHPPVPPVIGALDANGDKTISADEIANASAALKKLDKNGDGQLQKEELRSELPPRGEK